MPNTREEIAESAYFKMWEKDTSTVFLKTGNMLEEANRIQRMVCEGRCENILDNTTYQAGNLMFMQSQNHFSIVSSVALWADIATTDTTITIDTTNFASSGVIMIEDDIISYTGKTSTTLTGVTGISVRHLASGSTRVRQLYSVPNDLYKPIDLFFEDKPLYYQERNASKPFSGQYWELVEEEGVEYINVVWLESTSDTAILKYLKDSTDLTVDASETDLPRDFGVKIISNLLAGIMLYDTEEPEKAVRFLRAWYSAVKKLYKDYAERRRQFRKKVNTSPFTYL